MGTGQAKVTGGGREAAYGAVLAVLRGRGFASGVLRGAGLAGHDLALAKEIALGAVRHAITIECVLAALARYEPRRTPREVRAVLLTAAYQVIWMDRVPVFAAVDEAVAQARRHAGQRAAGMVNAVLRRLSAAVAERRVPWRRLDPTQVRVNWGESCAFARPVLPDPDGPGLLVRHLAAATSERPARYQELVVCHGADVAEQIAWASQAVPVVVLHRNRLRIDPQAFAERIRQDFGAGAVVCEDVAYLGSRSHLGESPMFGEGLAFVQDTTAHAAAELVGARSGERVLDLCAAPGGKSVALALAMGDEGEVVAADASAERLALVRENADRLGLRSIRVVTGSGADGLGGEPFDAALVDVPCSNTGVLARRPEARLGYAREKLAALLGVQQKLIEQADQHVRPGGRLVYSTCSLEPEENEGVVARFLETHPHWRLESEVTTMPAWGPRSSDWRDGGYAARLIRGAV